MSFLIWDAHACFSFKPGDEDMKNLERYRDAGVNYVSLNVGMDINPLNQCLHVVGKYRRYVQAHPDKYVLATSVECVIGAKAAGKLAVAFDLEGSEPLEGDLSLVRVFHDLGVKQMLLAYNNQNRASGGCKTENTGLTPFGRDLIAEMNRVGMILDVSHMSAKASLEAIECSVTPAVFSHSNPSGVWPHVRNLSDEQIKACARKGGVIGINGNDIFLGEDQTTPERLVEHVDYAVKIAGVDHVGIGLDYVVDRQELIDSLKEHPEVYVDPSALDPRFVEPDSFGRIQELLLQRYSSRDVAGLLAENFFRVAAATWRRPSSM